jgi:hypothetical protein
MNHKLPTYYVLLQFRVNQIWRLHEILLLDIIIIGIKTIALPRKTAKIDQNQFNPKEYPMETKAQDSTSKAIPNQIAKYMNAPHVLRLSGVG